MRQDGSKKKMPRPPPVLRCMHNKPDLGRVEDGGLLREHAGLHHVEHEVAAVDQLHHEAEVATWGQKKERKRKERKKAGMKNIRKKRKRKSQ